MSCLKLSTKIKFIIAAAAIAVVCIIAFIFAPKPNLIKVGQPLRIVIPGFQSSALVILAQEKGFFREQGLQVDLGFRATGFECLQMVLQGTADLAVAFETPVTHASTAGHQLAVLTEIHHSEANTAILARKGRGAASEPSLVGKKIGFVPKTNAEFLLELYFSSHLLDLKKSTLKQYNIKELVAALKSGEVDAAALWEPYVSKVITENPEDFTLLRTSYYTEFSMVVGLRDTVDLQKNSSEAVIKALLQAQKYYDTDTVEAQSAVEKVLTDHSFLVSPQPWKQMSIQLGLSRTLLAILDEESKWSQEKIGAKNQVIMKTTLHGRFLKSLAPDRVTYE